ncbi:MAG: hypothetical protein WC735_01770 [Candidatus Paceibacterota bacterium]|jgi:hypothetical protein
MGIDSKGFPTPEQRDPTPQDFQDLEIKVSGLGRGNLVHEIDFHMGMLKRVFGLEDSKKNPWPEYLRKDWDEHVREINIVTNKIKMEQAKEKGLL